MSFEKWAAAWLMVRVETSEMDEWGQDVPTVVCERWQICKKTCQVCRFLRFMGICSLVD